MRLRAVGLKVEERQEPDQMSSDFTECEEAKRKLLGAI